MQRRDFLLAASATLAERVFPLVSFSQASRKALLVGVGGAGTNELRLLSPRLPKASGVHFETCLIDFATLQDEPNTWMIRLDEVCTSSGCQHWVAQRYFKRAQFIDRVAVSHFDFAIILAAVRGGTGGGLAPVLASALKALGVDTHVIAMLPFSFESHTEAYQRDVLKALQASVGRQHLHIFPNDRAMVQAGDDGTIQDVLDVANSMILQMTQRIVESQIAAG